MNVRELVLVENNGPALAYLKAVLEQAGYAVRAALTGKEGLIEAWRAHTDVVIISGELPDLGYGEVIQKLRGDLRTAQVKIILLSTRSQPQDVMTAIKAGVNEFIVKQPGADAELLAKLKALTEPVNTAMGTLVGTNRLPPAGQIVAFLSAKGGTGVSSLCVNTAHLFAERTAKRVVVVDLVLPIGSLGYIVGVDTPGQNLVAATRLDAAQLSAEALQSLLSQPRGWKLHLLPGAPDPQTAQDLQVDHVEAVITELRRAFDAVFVDCGRTLSRVSLPLLRQAAKIIVVTSPDLATVALTKTVLVFLDSQGVRRKNIGLVLNRAVGLDGLSRPELERELGLAVCSLVPHLSDQFALANNQHVPLTTRLASNTVLFTLQDLTDYIAAGVREPAAA